MSLPLNRAFLEKIIISLKHFYLFNRKIVKHCFKEGVFLNFPKQPKLTVKKTVFERISTFLALAIMMGNILYLLFVWNSLPNKIAIHFTISGEADGWGTKWVLWIIPVISILLWGFLTLIENYPHTFNYIVKITEENAERQYRSARIFINIMKLETILFFFYINWVMIQIGLDKLSKPYPWDLLIFLGIVFSSIIIYMIHSYRIR